MSANDDAFTHLIDRAPNLRPEGWIDRTLVAYPREFGADLAPILVEAADCIAHHGDEQSRRFVTAADSPELRDQAIARARRILAGRPSAIERAAPALLHCGDGAMLVALAHPVPQLAGRAAIRVQLELHPEVMHAAAERIEAPAGLMLEWHRLGHSDPPRWAWQCTLPRWCAGVHRLAVEVVPNPSCFNEAMLVAHSGAGRVLVAIRNTPGRGPEDEWVEASVMPSGWSYLRGDRTMGSSRPYFPNGAPFPATHVRVPDDDLFAICAAHTWAGSLRDAVWLRNRPFYRVLS